MKEFKTEEKMLNTKLIFSDEYQRDVKPQRIKKILKDFNPNLVNLVKVSSRKGKYYVFDGQHTIAALKERNGGEDLLVKCKVYYGMTYEDEALLFALQDGEESRVTSDEKLWALYQAKDEDVLFFKATVEAQGFTCDFRGSSGNWKLVCYKKAFDVFKRHGSDFLAQELIVIAEAWGGMQDSVRAEIVGGLELFMSDYSGQLDTDRLIKKLHAESPVKICRDGKIKDYKGDRRFERVIFEIYNKNLKAGHLVWKW